jgi:hypothetical protein
LGFGANAVPATANTVGPHIVTYTDNGISTVTLSINGNASSTTSNLTVNPLPVMTFTTTDLFCADPVQSLNLTGTPAGGTFAGAGVSGNVFNPALSGIGSFNLLYSITDANSCTNSVMQSIQVESCLGVNENGLPTINIYPNPVIDEFVINVTSLDFEYYLSDVTGRIIRQGKAYDSKMINMAKNSSGIYFLTVIVDGKSQTKKIVNK